MNILPPSRLASIDCGQILDQLKHAYRIRIKCQVAEWSKSAVRCISGRNRSFPNSGPVEKVWEGHYPQNRTLCRFIFRSFLSEIKLKLAAMPDSFLRVKRIPARNRDKLARARLVDLLDLDHPNCHRCRQLVAALFHAGICTHSSQFNSGSF
jgi:hypothetical protein